MKKKAIVLASLLLALSLTACIGNKVEEGIKNPTDIVQPPIGSEIKYFYSATGFTDPELASNWGEWSTKTDIKAGVAELPYAKTVKLTTGKGDWDGTVLAFPGLANGFAKNYEKLEFKVKSSRYTEVVIKFAAGSDTGFEKTYKLSSGTPLTNGWVQMSIPLSDFSSVIDASNEFAIFNISEYKMGETIFLTDIALVGKKTVVNPPVDPPVVPPSTWDISSYIYSAKDGLLAKVDQWDSGAKYTDLTNFETYANVIRVESGLGWGGQHQL